ncbi:sensor histidine kinase [Lacticaseibacillus parakribbianus]|uniref:sensor histidine kinase n=1 Tax=Lacticaseibacillus parakribbianus TaxID=2970927 RepID=UPI0021CB8F8F|nr:HAMP domain-containing sensor histidine kinase [Lacticaseibacillus parakribbianus]
MRLNAFSRPEARAIAWLGLGLSGLTAGGFGVAAALAPAARLPLLALGAIAVAAIAWACNRWLRHVLAALDAIATQLHQAARGEVSYPLTQNDEGLFSALHNDLYHYVRQNSAAKAALAQDRAQLAVAIQDIAHQLRTPIATQANLIELLATADTGTTAELAQQNARLQALVEQLILLARVDTHTLSQNRQSVSLDALLRQSLNFLLHQIAEANLEVVWQVPAALTIEVNPRLMQEAFINLLKNAAEHAPAGSRLIVGATKTPLSTTITIQNFGEPLPAADLPHVFERFYRGSQSVPNSLGIGLAIAHGVIAAADGRVTLANTHPGVLTTVTLFH